MEFQLKYENMIKRLYELQDEKIDYVLKDVNKKIQDEIEAVNWENVEKGNYTLEKMKEIFNKIEDNNDRKISKYCESLYEQGFKDGVNLMVNCFKDKEKEIRKKEL